MVEIIGFIISLLALLYLFIKQSIPSQRQVRPIGDENEEFLGEDPFRDFMKAVEKEAAARESAQHAPPPPPPPSKITKKPKKPISLSEHQLTSQIENRRLRSQLEDRHLTATFHQREDRPGHSPTLSASLHLDEMREHGPSRAQMAIQRLADRRDLLIYQEIMDKPKSLRS